jgi:phage gp36-like protein
MIYATIQDISDRYGQGVLAAVDRDGDSQADTGALDKALADASALIDSYLSQRYTLPLPVVPEIVKRTCVDLALYQVVRGGTQAAEDYRLRNEDAISWLRNIATGMAALDLPAPQQASGNQVRFTGQERQFTRDTLKGF